MGMARWIRSWPVYRQLTGPDPLGRGRAAESRRSETLSPRTEHADRMAVSVCPYCEAGVASTKDPKYVVVPQRERLQAANGQRHPPT